MVESYVRGTWVFRCADKKGVADFKNSKLKKFSDLLTDIEAVQPGRTLLSIKNVVKDLHDFTHTGINQVRRRKIGGGKYPDEDLEKAYNITSVFGLFAALELASLSTDHERRVHEVSECLRALPPLKT